MKTSVFVLLLLAIQFSFAQNPLKPVQLNIFKNGTYFLVREGSVPVKNNEASIHVPQSPMLSTFWLTTEKSVNIEQIRFFSDTLKKKRDILGIPELLKYNIGKQLKFTYLFDDKNLRTVSGKLLSYNITSGLMNIEKNDKSYLLISSSYIKEIQFSQKPTLFLEADSVVRRGFVRFSKISGAIPLRMSYMQSGIQWTPTYNIKVLDDKELQLELKATVENYKEEDIKNTELVLTVGSPNFFYGAQLDPIATSYLSTASSMFDQKGQTYMFDNFQTIANESSTGSPYDYNENYNYNTQGTKSNDLYFYKCGMVNLPKNSKSTIMIFAKNIPYNDIYEVNISDGVNYQSNRYVAQTDNNRQTVFHSLRITNTTNQPFTTGPVFVLDQNLMPLAQDKLKYTAVNSEVSIQLARSSDVIVKYTEEEIVRQDNYKTINKHRYAKVTIKGNISIENLQAKDINLKIDKTIHASISECSDSGDFKKIGSYYGVNPVSKIKWDLKIKGGAKKVISYTYDVLI